MDSISILRALTVKSQFDDISVHMIVQLMEPQNKTYLIAAGISEDQIVCVNEVGVVAQ